MTACFDKMKKNVAKITLFFHWQGARIAESVNWRFKRAVGKAAVSMSKITHF